MWRYLVGGIAALLLAGAGVLVFAHRPLSGEVLHGEPAATRTDAAQALPDAVPEASEKTREQKRFDRYDKDRNGQIAREEYLASRRKAFAKLDADHDGKLSFYEWAIKTTTKFADADADKSGTMSPAEFVKTAPKRVARPKCACPEEKREEE